MTQATIDLRNDLARARDEWLESKEGERCASGFTQGQYLRNRLVCAFIAGWCAAEQKPKAASQ